MTECHCVLPQYRNRKKPIYHKFVVFSIIDDSGTVIPKHAECNNCGVIHNVYDICKSEVLPGREMGAVMKEEDIKLLLNDSLINMLETYDCDVATWEHVLFLTQEKQKGSVILNKQEEDGIISGKVLKIEGPGKYRLDPFSYRNSL